MSFSLLVALILASPPPSAVEFDLAQPVSVAESMIPAITRIDNPQDHDLEWILLLPEEVRSSLVNELADVAELDRPACDMALMLILRNDSIPNFRARSASGLNPNRSRKVQQALIAALGDVDSSVRLMACQSLMDCKDQSVAKSVVPLLNDDVTNVRYVAARTLGRLEFRESLPELRLLYQQSNPNSAAVTNLAEAFSRLGDETMALKAISPLMASKNWNVRHSVHLSLQRVKSKNAVALLIDNLEVEMQRELSENRWHGFQLPTRTMREVCRQLDDRTGQSIGVDPQAWSEWWSQHAGAFGGSPQDGPKGNEFESLCARYKLAVETGYEPGLPELFTGRLSLARAKESDTEEGNESLWSNVINGVRLRVLAPAVFAPNQYPRLNVLVQNTTDKTIVMPNLSLAPTFDSEKLPKREYARPRSQAAWKLSPRGTSILSISLRQPSRNQVVRASYSPAIIDRSIEYPAVDPGLYELTFTFDSAVGSEPSDSHDAPEAWKGRLVSPTVLVEIRR